VTARQEYWVVDPAAGDYAKVSGTDQRDELLRQGWQESDEPADDAMVLIWHEGIAEPGRVPAGTLRDLWGHRGWVAGPPRGFAHPAEAAADVPADTAERDETKPKKSAAGRSKDEE